MKNKKKILITALVLLILSGIASYLLFPELFLFRKPLAEKSIYDFSAKSSDGTDIKLDSYKGKVLLIVNVASKCGFTPQYEGLQRIYSRYQPQGLEIIGFPANNFLWQEPGSDDEIKTFCRTKYGVTFPVLAKISVRGADKHPIYRFLTEKQTDPQFSGEISWNFNKFVVDRTGRIVARFGATDEPESAQVKQAIENALKSGQSAQLNW